MTPPYLHVVMSNGLVVERKGKNSDLKVTDPSGQKAGQQLLNSFVEKLALDLPRFMQASDKEKADTLLKVIGVGDQLKKIEQEERSVYEERLYVGRTADQKKKFADEQQYFPDAPKDLVSPSELIRQQQEILARNGENQRKRENLRRLEEKAQKINDQLSALLQEQKKVQEDLEIARKSAADLHDESTAELEKNLAEIDEINRKVRINLDKDKAEEDALSYKNQYDALTGQLTEIRARKQALLDNAALPLAGLSVKEGKLTYNGMPWDGLSGAEQLIVSTAIIRKLNPECGFVLMDKLEQMDLKTLDAFNQWLIKEGLQVIATRVSTGDECSIIIEDGYSMPAGHKEKPAEPLSYTEGGF